jgi:hypothetical protein
VPPLMDGLSDLLLDEPLGLVLLEPEGLVLVPELVFCAYKLPMSANVAHNTASFFILPPVFELYSNVAAWTPLVL